MWSVEALSKDLAAGRTSSRELTEQALARIADPAGEGGSKILARAPAATVDAPAVARLRAAGAVIVGRSTMVEFAFGGVGTNPHYGTPKNPWDRKSARVPGGSSSGAAVAVADGMCVMGLGTDTRGSIRQPAALCGVTGFKPTARRVSRQGAFPLLRPGFRRSACEHGRLLRGLRRGPFRR